MRKLSCQIFKQLVAFILLLTFGFQTFSRAFIVVDYYTNTSAFAKNCENKARPKIKNKTGLAPNAGLQYEKVKTGSDKGFNVHISDGNILLGTIGVETSFKKIAIGANFQKPLSQNLANGIVHAKNRAMVHLAFML